MCGEEELVMRVVLCNGTERECSSDPQVAFLEFLGTKINECDLDIQYMLTVSLKLTTVCCGRETHDVWVRLKLRSFCCGSGM